MNWYVSVIRETVEHIENHLDDDLTAAAAARRANISTYHFNRMFSAVTGTPLKQYIAGRKLTRATELLRRTDHTVLDIALGLGYRYPEVFSRAFKRQFGMAPARYRQSGVELPGLPKARIVERDIINYRGSLGLSGTCIRRDAGRLAGVASQFRKDSAEARAALTARHEAFILGSRDRAVFVPGIFHTVVRCSGRDDGTYAMFCGRELAGGASAPELASLELPAGWYASFRYRGDMFLIGDAFLRDLYHWILINEAELLPGAIGMLNVYTEPYPETGSVEVLVPLRQPV